MSDFINSFSAFGDKREAYMSLFPLIIRMHYSLHVNPKWKIRLTTDRVFDSSNFYGRQINNLADRGLLQLRIVANGGSIWEQSTKGIGMLWRLLPAWEDNEYVFCRDLDSILTPRQAKFVQNFIDSDRVVHGINDNNAHTIPLMGGMIGVKSKRFVQLIGHPSFADMVSSWRRNREGWDSHGQDQCFLMERIWPKVSSHSLIHRIEGPNDRCHMKDCVPGVILEGVSQRILDEGDNFTNYIGASNCKNTTYGERSIAEMSDFYEEHGNKEMINKIKEAEKV
jgi:hypothetical protein